MPMIFVCPFCDCQMFPWDVFNTEVLFTCEHCRNISVGHITLNQRADVQQQVYERWASPDE